MRMTRIHALLITISLATACQEGPAVVAQHQQAARQQAAQRLAVLSAAQAELPTLLEAIPEGFETHHGFPGRQLFAGASLAAPYEMVTLERAAAGERPQLRSLGQWRIPVHTGGAYRALITVERSGDAYQAVEIGAAGLARELYALRTRAGAGFAQADGQQAILRLFHLGSDLLLEALPGRALSSGTLLPLASARAALALTKTELQGLSALGHVLEAHHAN